MREEGFSLARLDHLELFFLILLYEGSLCPKCGHGTRVLSKGWAKCKECGERVERRKWPPEGEDED